MAGRQALKRLPVWAKHRADKPANRLVRNRFPEIGGLGYLAKAGPLIPEIQASRKPVHGQVDPPAVRKDRGR